MLLGVSGSFRKFAGFCWIHDISATLVPAYSLPQTNSDLGSLLVISLISVCLRAQPNLAWQAQCVHSPLHASNAMVQHMKGTCTFVEESDGTSDGKACGKPIDPAALEQGVVCCTNPHHRKGLLALGIKHPNLQKLQSGFASKMQVHYRAGWPFDKNKVLKKIHLDVVSGVQAARALDGRAEEAERKAHLHGLMHTAPEAVPANTSDGDEEDEGESAKAVKLLKQAASLNEAVCPEASKVLQRAAEAYIAGRQLMSNVVLPPGAVVTDPQREAFEAIKVSVADWTGCSLRP